MARTVVNAQTLPGAYPTQPITGASLDLAFTADDGPLDLVTPIVDSKTVILAWNTDVAAQDITFNSVAIPTYNREGDITYAVGAGKIARFGPFKSVGWATSNNLEFDLEDNNIRVAVLTLP